MARKARSPSFSYLKPASAVSSRVKSRNRRSNTIHEVILRRELWRSGLRYRKNVEDLPGKPDIVFATARVIVFCDGDFWHGRNWRILKSKLRQGANAQYWLAKIASNIQRDKRITKSLQKAGWQVVRLWETDIKRNPTNAAIHIKRIVSSRLALNQKC